MLHYQKFINNFKKKNKQYNITGKILEYYK